MKFYFSCRYGRMISGLVRLGLEIEEGSRHTLAKCVKNGQKTTIPRHGEIKREIVGSICKFLLVKDFTEKEILEVLKKSRQK